MSPEQDNQGRSPLVIAHEHGQAEVVDWLREQMGEAGVGSKLEEMDTANLSSPMHRAVALGDENLVALFLKGAATVDERDHFGRTCLHLTAIASQNPAAKTAPVIAETLVAAGFDGNAKDEKGNSPFMLACFRGKKQLVKLLLPKVPPMSPDLLTAVRTAAMAGHVEVVEAILQSAKGDGKRMAFLVGKGSGSKLEDWATDNGQSEVAKMANRFMEYAD